MNFRHARVRATFAVAATIAGACAAGTTSAQDAGLCAEPGLPLLDDPAGDVDFQFLPAGLPLDMYDMQSLQVAVLPPPEEGATKVVFTLKVGSLAQLLPRTAFFATFEGPDKRTHGVRMVVAEDQSVAFQSYLVLVDTDGNVTEGRYPETGSVKPALEESSYDADGTIRVVVEAAEAGMRKPGLLSGFNAGSLQQIPTGDTLTPSGDLLALIADGMPDSMERSGEVDPAACATESKSLGGIGGSLGWMGLVLLALAGLRRRLR